MEQIFKQFIDTYKKVYNDEAEYKKRFDIFSKNYEFINNHNSELNASSFTVGINEFADLTKDEFESLYTPSIIKN